MKKWFKIISIILVFALLSIILYITLNKCGLLDINTIKASVLRTGKYGVVVYTIILIIALVCFCFVPLLNSGLSILGIALFGAPTAFISNLIAIFFSTSILFFIGDKFGEKFSKKLVGEKAFEEAQNLIDHKSKFWLPIFFIIPCIPDEAICLIAGMTKIKYWYLLVVSLIYHAIEVGLFCFLGSGLIPWSSLSLFDWILFVNIVLVDLYLLIKFEKYLEKRIKK